MKLTHFWKEDREIFTEPISIINETIITNKLPWFDQGIGGKRNSSAVSTTILTQRFIANEIGYYIH